MLFTENNLISKLAQGILLQVIQSNRDWMYPTPKNISKNISKLMKQWFSDTRQQGEQNCDL